MSDTKPSPAKSQSLLRSTSVVSAMTMISRIVGFMRDMVIAYLFGASAGMDAFLVAFKVPNFMRRLFAEGSFSQAFVPVLSEYQQQRTHEEVQTFVQRMAGYLTITLCIVTVVAILATPLLIHLFAPGFGEGTLRYVLAKDMLRITAPYLMLISLTAMAGAILNTYGLFGVPAFTPVLLNFVMIAAAFWLAPHLSQPIVALAWGVFIAGILQLLFQLPFLHRIRISPIPKFHRNDPGVKRVMKLIVPGLFGVSISQINILVDTMFASFLAIGSVSWLYYSNQLSNLPLGVFGVAVATVILPHLSRHHASQSTHSFSASLDWGISNILLVALPATIGLVVLSGPIVTTLYHHGHFTVHDVVMTQRSLIAFSLGLPAFMLIKIFAAGFYARLNIRTPVVIGAIAMLSNIILNFLLIKPLAHAGLALSTTLAAYLNGGLLLYLLLRQGIYRPQTAWLTFALRLVFANSLLTFLLWNFTQPLNDWLLWSTKQRIQTLGLSILIALVGYLACIFILKIKLTDGKKTVVNEPFN